MVYLVMLSGALISFKRMPFLRLLLALITGILLQWNFSFSLPVIIISFLAALLFLVAFLFISSAKKFTLRWLQGMGILLIFIVTGAAVILTKDTRNHANWIGHLYEKNATVIATLEEPLTDKTKSYKAQARVTGIIKKGVYYKTEGSILLYIKKDSTATPALDYGSQVVLMKPLQEITNSGNPGGFDYKRYSAFQDVYYQVFVTQKDYVILPHNNSHWLQQLLYNIRTSVLKTLQQNITSPKEQGVAEALLIGYRNDLDKELVQAYSNTGVVHIIAISGLHLGLIYGLLKWLFGIFKNKHWNKIIKPVFILLVLWLFTLVAGAVPSILRSAVMFSFIVIGESLGRRTNIYNTLAASAFCLLIFDPFFLWDVGFLLSYAAVVSIVAFMRPVYNQLYFKNKLLDGIWQLNAVTLSAQVLTLPLILYYFHQFPNLFLITNFIAVPLSSFILYGELLLLLVSKISWLAVLIGKLTHWLIWLMDRIIENTNQIPFSQTGGIQITILQSAFLYLAIILLAVWLSKKLVAAFVAGLTFLSLFFAVRCFDMLQRNNQQKVIVYNVPQHTAVDVIQQRQFVFIGDTALLQDGFLQNFHLKPSRILHRIQRTENLQIIYADDQYITSAHKRLFILKGDLPRNTPTQRIVVDAVIICKNPRLSIGTLSLFFDCRQIVFDSSNPLWKIAKWKKDCDSLHLRFFSVPEQGAFEMNL